jgi:(S)-2-hydroxyglutarate dehydrogenase
MQEFDCIVIGGGIVGLSVAWTILENKPGARVGVLEKEEGCAQHQTGRNSGVIHSGIYYKPGSLKAKMCREGNRRMIDFCATHGIQHERCGKVIVATTESEIPLLENLYDRGTANGVGVKRLTASQVCELEPHVACLGGVQVDSTGIVDYGAVSRKLAELIGNRGGVVRYGTKVVGFRAHGDQTILETSKEPVTAHWIINCAGLHSDRIARSAGVEPEARIVPFRGEYYELRPESRHLVRNLIYPVPDPIFPFLGVHFTRMIDGSVHAGPNAVLSLKREGYHRTSFDLRDFTETMTYAGFWRLALKHGRAGMEEIKRSLSKKAFVRSLQKLIPEIREEDLVQAAAGVRAQALRADGGLVDDFLIIKGSKAVHVCNAPSPAATASLEIARTIVDQVAEFSGRQAS